MNPFQQVGLILSAFVADCLRSDSEFERHVSGLCCLVAPTDAQRVREETRMLRDAVYREGARGLCDKAALDRIVRDSIWVAYHAAGYGCKTPLESMRKAAALLLRAEVAEMAGAYRTACIMRLAVRRLRGGLPLPGFPAREEPS